MPGRSGVKRAARAVACALLLSVVLPGMAAPALSDLAQQIRAERVQAYEGMVLQFSARIESGDAQGRDRQLDRRCVRCRMPRHICVAIKGVRP